MKLNELKRIISSIQDISVVSDRSQMYEKLHAIGIEPSNFYQELEMTSRYVDTHQDVSYSNDRLSLHSHDFYEILYCRNAKDVEYLVGPDRYLLQKGDIIFVPPGVSHRPILPEHTAEPYVRDVLWISTEFMNTLFTLFSESREEYQDQRLQLRTAGTGWERIEDLFRLGVQEAEGQKPGWESIVMGNTMMILSYIQRAFAQPTTPTMKAEKTELLDQVTAYIEQNYHRHILLSELAKRFYVSESTISHTFKEKIGVSIYRYITQRRLIAAKALLAENLALEDIAVQVGFTDYSTFYRAFKKEYGISPRQLRKRQENAHSETGNVPII